MARLLRRARGEEEALYLDDEASSEDEDDEEDSEDSDDGDGGGAEAAEAAEADGAAAPTFDWISPTLETPWSAFLGGAARLLAWLAALVMLQLMWAVRNKGDVDLAYLPVSFLVVPAAAFASLRNGRLLGPQAVEGIQLIFLWMCSANKCLWDLGFGGGKMPPTDRKLPLRQLIVDVGKDPPVRGGIRYNCGLACIIVACGGLAVGEFCWPIGYFYLSDYSYWRCRSICQQLEAAGPPGGANAPKLRLKLQGNKTYGELVEECRTGFDSSTFPTTHYQGSWRYWWDLHWLLVPEGAWVVGQPCEGDVLYDTDESYTFSNSLDCRRVSQNGVVLIITGLLTLSVVILSTLRCKSYALVAATSTSLALLCATGILQVWIGWVHCRQVSLSHCGVVYSHLLHSCLSVASYNGTQYGKLMLQTGNKFLAYESNFRNAHEITRSEVWFGGVMESILLVMTVMAHSTFRLKRMQTRKARFELVCKRPRLVECLADHPEIVRRLAPRDMVMLAWTLDSVHRAHTDEFRAFKKLEEKMDRLLDMEVPPCRVDGVERSFWPAAVYSLVRAMTPCLFRQFLPTKGYATAVPEANSLWMVSAMMTILTQFMAYHFILFQFMEASRRYARGMQSWLAFESAWSFPSHSALAGDARTEIVQVTDGEHLAMLDHQDLAEQFSFSNEHVGTEGCLKDELVNVKAVKDWLPTWWAWREYLVIDYTDKRVRLELHFAVAITMLAMSIGLILIDTIRNSPHPDLTSASKAVSWLSGGVTAMSFQVVWDLLFLSVPVLHSIHTAATLNHLIELQLKRVLHLEECLEQPTAVPDGNTSPATQSPAEQDEVGSRVRHVFRLAKAESVSGSSSMTRLLSVVKINKRTLAIVGTLLSLCTGGQLAEIFTTIAGAASSGD